MSKLDIHVTELEFSILIRLLNTSPITNRATAEYDSNFTGWLNNSDIGDKKGAYFSHPQNISRYLIGLEKKKLIERKRMLCVGKYKEQKKVYFARIKSDNNTIKRIFLIFYSRNVEGKNFLLNLLDSDYYRTNMKKITKLISEYIPNEFFSMKSNYNPLGGRNGKEFLDGNSSDMLVKWIIMSVPSFIYRTIMDNKFKERMNLFIESFPFKGEASIFPMMSFAVTDFIEGNSNPYFDSKIGITLKTYANILNWEGVGNNSTKQID